MRSLMYAYKMRLVFILYLNTEEISQTEFKFMGTGMLNTEVRVLAKQLFWVLKDRQLSLKISISKRTVKHLLFSKFGCVVVRFFGKYNIAEKYILIGPVSILGIHIERRPSAAHTFSKSEKT